MRALQDFLLPILGITLIIGLSILSFYLMDKKDKVLPDKTYTFCLELIKQEERGYRDTDILATCFEYLSGMKVEK